MQVINDRIDFNLYMQGPDEAGHVHPASSWLDEVVSAFEQPANLKGATLPWSETQDILRLKRGEFSIWTGMSGHGKSMLLGQVVLHLMTQGEKICIASMEMKPVATIQRMCRQAFASKHPNKRNIEDLHQWTNGRLWLYDQQGQVSPDRILMVARYCHKELGVTHLVIDNLLSCGIPEEGIEQQKQFILALATHAHDTGQAVHLVAHTRKGMDELTPPSIQQVRGSSSITDLADNVFSIWRNRRKEAAQDEGKKHKDGDEDAQLEVCKRRHGDWDGKMKLWFHRNSLTYLQRPDEQPKPMVFRSTMNGASGNGDGHA